jgi:hypothetical protein
VLHVRLCCVVKVCPFWKKVQGQGVTFAAN